MNCSTRMVMKKNVAPAIRCETTVVAIGSRMLVLLPKSASAKLPSRGMAMAEGTLNGARFQFELEPDGKGSHWFEPGKNLRAGDTVTLEMTPVETWPEPKVPADLKRALADNPAALEVWMDTTPMARWDWIRSIKSTNNPDTRKKRIAVACDKLRKGNKRQCCFNRSMCTDPEVSKGGVLLSPQSSAEL